MKNKLLYCLVLSLTVCFSGTAWAEKAPKLPKLAPPPIVSQWKEERVKVADTGEFSSMSIPEKNNSAKGKDRKKRSRTAAEQLSEKGKKFFWKPSPLLSSTLRTADLTGAALSEDASLLVVAERIGGEGKANSTRLLFFDIGECRLAGGFVLPEVLISSIAFCPGSKKELLGIRHKFAPYKVKDGLVKIDLNDKCIIDFLDSPGGAITSFSASGGGKIFFTVADTPAVFEQDGESFAVSPKRLKCRISSPRVCADRRLLTAYGREGVEIYRPDHGRWIPEEKLFTFPAPFQPASCRVIDPGVPAICFAGNYEDDLWYFRNGVFRKLKERISGKHVWDSKQKLFFAEIASNSQVVLFTMPEAAEMPKAVKPNRLKPANRNGSFALLRTSALPEKMVQIDNRGNVFLLDYTRPARWKKSIVHITDRTGFR